jgi:hypothetical protein
MTVVNKARSAEDANRFRLALAPVDEAFHRSEQRWGVSRLERLVSTPTLASYQRGWERYRVALEECDAAAVEEVGPLMIQALAFMDAEASAAGHAPLDPVTWEAPMSDGAVLVVVRTNAEAIAVQRAALSIGSAPPPLDDRLPPDLALAVRAIHEGRRLEVWTLAEIVRLIEAHAGPVEANPRRARRWEGSDAPTGVQADEGAAADLARRGWPLDAPLATGAGTDAAPRPPANGPDLGY